MTRQTISSGGPFEAVFGYARAVRFGDQIHVSGTCAPAGHEASDTYEQAKAALAIIERALHDAGASPADVVRTVVYVVDMADAPLMARAPRGDVRRDQARQHDGAGHADAAGLGIGSRSRPTPSPAARRSLAWARKRGAEPLSGNRATCCKQAIAVSTGFPSAYGRRASVVLHGFRLPRSENVRSRFLSLRQPAPAQLSPLPREGLESLGTPTVLAPTSGLADGPLLRDVLCWARLSGPLACAGLVRSCRSLGEQGFAGESMWGEFVNALG